MRRLVPLLAAGGAGGYLLVARGALTLDLGVGRRVRPLGPLVRSIAAPPETVFDVVAGPYLGRTPRALQDKLQVWERGSDMCSPPTSPRSGASPRRPSRPSASSARTRSRSGSCAGRCRTWPRRTGSSARTAERASQYRGELGADLSAVGAWWAGRLAGAWERAVAASVEQIAAEAERRTR